MSQLLRLRSGFAVLLLGLALVTAARAQVTFTIIATAGSDPYTTSHGYVANNSYTFVFTMPASYANNPDSAFTLNNQTAWYDVNTTTDANLFAAITGSGLAGTYVRPTTSTESPYSVVATGVGVLELAAGSNDPAPNSIGLTTLSSTVLGDINVVVTNSAAFSQGSTYLEPATYFAFYNGNYPSAAGDVTLEDGNDNTVGSFSVKSITISAVPEPATTAELIGLAGLGAVLLSRRRRAAA